MGSLIPNTVRRYRDPPALTCDGRTASFAEFNEATDPVGSALLSGGLEPGDRVSVLLPNGIEGTREAEDALTGHPAVREAAVVGLPTERWGETVHAVVSLRPGIPTPTQEELVGFAGERLAGYKKPRSLAVREDMPKARRARSSAGASVTRSGPCDGPNRDAHRARSSRRAITISCTSSGPSAICSSRACA